MLSVLKKRERIWASLAHVPTITIIWIGYLLYRFFSDHAFIENIMRIDITAYKSPPITPIILTLLGIPISLTIMHLKKKSVFVHDNAQEAYFFNVWLLKRYCALFVVSFIGILFSCKPILVTSSIVGLIISLICLQQSIAGIMTTFRGKVYHYWYPLRWRSS